MRKNSFFILLFLFCLMMNAYAAEQESGVGMPPPPPPGMSDGGNPGQVRAIPQEAITACTGKAAGTSCVAGRGGSGICGYTPDKKYFACKPNGRGPAHPNQTDKESLVRPDN